MPLATTPAWCPPIPSQTPEGWNCGGRRGASSLWARLRPTSVAPANSSGIAPSISEHAGRPARLRDATGTGVQIRRDATRRVAARRGESIASVWTSSLAEERNGEGHRQAGPQDEGRRRAVAQGDPAP